MNLSLSELTGIFCLGLLFSGSFSMLEAAVISQDKHRLHHLGDEGEKRALIMRRLLTRTDKLLSTLLLCNNLANVTCAAAATAIAVRLLPESDSALLWVTLIVTFILLVFSEITPKVIGVRYADAISLRLARTLDIMNRILQPLTAVAIFFSNILLYLSGNKTKDNRQNSLNIAELRSAVRAAGRADEQNPDHYQLLEKTLRFNDLTVEKIMTPRHAIRGINLQQDSATITQLINEIPHNKLPLYDGNMDNTLGVVDTMAALKLARDDALTPQRLKTLMAPAHYIPAAATALQQLRTMRQQQQRLALVADGKGRVVGLLTFANFAAAIIGEEAPAAFTIRPDGALIISGDTTLLQLEQLQQGSSAPDFIDATTVSGMIVEYLGDLPKDSLCVKLKDWQLEILSTDDKSVRQVALLPPVLPPDSGD